MSPGSQPVESAASTWRMILPKRVLGMSGRIHTRHIGILSLSVHTISVQLLAHHTARQRGTEADKPSNLAKSVAGE